jgi:hypothetical protein
MENEKKSNNSTVVKHSNHHPKVKGSSLCAADIEREEKL